MQLVFLKTIFNTPCMCPKVRCDGESWKKFRTKHGLSLCSASGYSIKRRNQSAGGIGWILSLPPKPLGPWGHPYPISPPIIRLIQGWTFCLYIFSFITKSTDIHLLPYPILLIKHDILQQRMSCLITLRKQDLYHLKSEANEYKNFSKQLDNIA